MSDIFLCFVDNFAAKNLREHQMIFKHIIPIIYFSSQLKKITLSIFLIYIISHQVNYANQDLIINKIHISGNKLFSTQKIISVLDIHSGEIFSREKLNNNIFNILHLYEKYGYYLAEILPPEVIPCSDGDKLDIFIRIMENQKLIIDSISFRNNRYYNDKRLKAMIGSKQASTFNLQQLYQDMQTICEQYAEKGYPFCSVNIDTIAIYNDKLSLCFDIQENGLTRMCAFQYQGNEITKAKTINKMLRLNKDEIYKESKVRAGEKYLQAKPYISKACIRPLDNKNILISITESKMNNIYGMLGYKSSQENLSFSEKLFGFFNVSFLNLFGTDRSFFLYWKKLQKHSSLTKVQYYEPFIFNYPLSAEVELFRKVTDTLYVNTGLKFSCAYNDRNYNKYAMLFNIEHILPGSGRPLLIDFSRTYKKGIGVELNISTIDYPLNPRAGTHYLGRYIFNWSINDKNEKVQEQRIEVSIAHNIEIFRNNVVYMKMSGKNISSTSKKIPVYELYYLGGYDDVRGFLDDQFCGFRLGYLNLEYRWLLTQKSRIFLFTDWGYYKSDDKERKDLFSIGFGLRLQTVIGLLGLDYAVSHSNGKWENPLNGIVHFNIQTEF
ncbi:MAG: hypothetical protein DRH57_05440 [Candidatus Cloacimonadota bacterium]|nr:MAG: hypothetical protein DRH57_05440 [Candidatus Cloacimonadota bacterium]